LRSLLYNASEIFVAVAIMIRQLRPAGLALVSIVLTAGAIALYLWPGEQEIKATPLFVGPDDREIAWLAPATSSANWERFLSALKRVVAGMGEESPALFITEDDRQAFPEQTTSVPEIALSLHGKQGRLWLRWYKLTSDLKIGDWTKALLGRNPPPLAIVGGSASDQAIELATSMSEMAARLRLGDASPLLLLTQATVGDLAPGGPSLNSVYAGKILRFCFTDRQMARMIADFLWDQEDFRPDSAPIYLTYWDDDPYSKDLNQCFCEVLPFLPLQETGPACGWPFSTASSPAFPLDLLALWWAQSRSVAPESCPIYYSVGTYAEPNRWEEEAAMRLMETKQQQHPEQNRALLVVPAATQPARRFVIATGDSIGFNALYRDRNMAWPIQDLPFSLVAFCHRNPVATYAGFAPETETSPASARENGQTSAGTEDLLLHMDLLSALLRGCLFDKSTQSPHYLPLSAKDLRDRLLQARWGGESAGIRFDGPGPYFFDDEGNRRSGTGEHVVSLRPLFKNEAVLPEAWLEIWARTSGIDGPSPKWQQVRELALRYEGYLAPEGDANANPANH
jgi:hypothetical protein